MKKYFKRRQDMSRFFFFMQKNVENTITLHIVLNIIQLHVETIKFRKEGVK